jgi:uncharacterized protein YjcR
MYSKDTIELARRYYVIDNRSIENIAEDMQINPVTIRTWKNRGQWDIDKEKNQNFNSFMEDAYKFAAFLNSEFEKQVRDGKKIDKEQVKLFEVLMSRTENIIKVDIERKKLNKVENNMEDIPEEVARIPRVQEAILVINKAISEYNRKKKENV